MSEVRKSARENDLSFMQNLVYVLPYPTETGNVYPRTRLYRLRAVAIDEVVPPWIRKALAVEPN